MEGRSSDLRPPSDKGDPSPIDTETQRRLLEGALGMLEGIVALVLRRYPRADCDNVRAGAYDALTRAASAFNPGPGRPFERFAWWRVYRAARDAAGPVKAFSLAGATTLADTEDLKASQARGAEDEAEDLERCLAEGIDEVAGGYALSLASAAIQQMGEDGLIVVHDRMRARAALSAAVAALSPEDRRLLDLRFIQRRKARDVAATLGVSKSTVDRRCRALRAHLRRALAAVGIHRAPLD